MTAMKPKKRSSKVYSQTNAPSLAGRQTERSMNYWLERISPEDAKLLWQGLQASVWAANQPTKWVRMASGTTSKVGLRGGVIAFTMERGFALHFIEEST